MISKTDIAWLAGFLDGDGCFTIQIYKSTSADASVKINPYITIKQIVRDDNSWFEKVKNIYNKLGITYSHRIGDGKNYRYYDVSVRSEKSAKKLIKLILPHLTVKKRIAELILNEFPPSRKTNYAGHNYDPKTGRFIGGGNTYTVNWNNVNAAASFVDKLRHLNSPVSGSKGRANLKWTGQAIIDFYRDLETSQSLSS